MYVAANSSPLPKFNLHFISQVRSHVKSDYWLHYAYSSIHVYHDDFRRKDFREISYLILLIKCDDMLRFRTKSNKNKGYFTCIPMCIHDPQT